MTHLHCDMYEVAMPPRTAAGTTACTHVQKLKRPAPNRALMHTFAHIYSRLEAEDSAMPYVLLPVLHCLAGESSLV